MQVWFQSIFVSLNRIISASNNFYMYVIKFNNDILSARVIENIFYI